jgi:hypothetical protein
MTAEGLYSGPGNKLFYKFFTTKIELQYIHENLPSVIAVCIFQG